MVEHQEHYYGGAAWANELAKRGYVVLVPDVFSFASRRFRAADLPERIKGGLVEQNPESPEEIDAYNRFAGNHEHLIAKSLFCGGMTWPGVFVADDRAALDVLCARTEVDAERVGCCGLSGGGLRTVYLTGADPRIRCSVPVGMMTTWRDYLLYKCHTHTWMIYIPGLPRDLDYPEILGLNAPNPTLVLSNNQDQLLHRRRCTALTAFCKRCMQRPVRRIATRRASTTGRTSLTAKCKPRLSSGSTAGWAERNSHTQLSSSTAAPRPASPRRSRLDARDEA